MKVRAIVDEIKWIILALIGIAIAAYLSNPIIQQKESIEKYFFYGFNYNANIVVFFSN